MPEPMNHWFVCMTKPRQEAKAVAKLQEQGYEVYLPILALWERKKEAWCKHEQVMFPRYCFVRCGINGQSIAPIRSTPGVTSLVRFGIEVATLSEAAVAAIRDMVEQRGREPPTMPFKAGMSVVVSDGPLKGLAGLVSDVAKERVAVMLTLLGREKRIVFPVDHLATA